MNFIYNKAKTMHYILIVFMSMGMSPLAMHAQESTWQVDPSHSKIGFHISYFKVSTITGGFDDYAGSFTQEGSVLSGINITLKTASINTNQADRDKHLRSTDFFSAALHPEIQFTSTSITKTGANSYEIKGDFTMTGITKSITLKGVDKGSFVHPRFKTNNKFITITGLINREDFKVGTNYPPAKMALGNEVTLTAAIQITENN